VGVVSPAGGRRGAAFATAFPEVVPVISRGGVPVVTAGLPGGLPRGGVLVGGGLGEGGERRDGEGTSGLSRLSLPC